MAFAGASRRHSFSTAPHSRSNGSRVEAGEGGAAKLLEKVPAIIVAA